MDCHTDVEAGRTSAAIKALDFVDGAQVVGLGTGRAASAFVRALGQRVGEGLRLKAVPTSQATADIAEECGIPLVTLDDVEEIDVTVDGADEVDPKLHLIKGYGAALVREKIVAAASRRLVILVGPEKLVSVLGQRGKLPVEVLPFGAVHCRRKLKTLGMGSEVRTHNGAPVVTDNGNYILDCLVESIPDPDYLDRNLCAVPGVLGTGIFAGMAEAVIVDDESGARVLRRS